MPAFRVSCLAAIAVAAASLACAPRNSDSAFGGAASASADGGTQCTPLETRAPNAKNQRPAFAGQTRTCGVKSNVAFDVNVVATGLEKPWSVEPLPGGDFLVTRKVDSLFTGHQFEFDYATAC